MSAPKVFISYSHDSEAHKALILDLSTKLRTKGVNCFIDRYINGSPKEGWRNWMRSQIDDADFVLIVCTETYRRRYEGKDREGGRGATFEGVIIGQTLYQEFQQNERFIPLIPEEGSYEHVPTELKDSSVYRITKDFETLYRVLTDQPEVTIPPLGNIEKVDEASTPNDSGPLAELPVYELTQVSHTSENPIQIDQLPTVAGDFVGREAELQLLDDAFKSSSTNILQFIAAGGTGKTKLLRHWLNERKQEGKVQNHIVWSFYSQGTTDTKQVSASPLFEAGFKAFGINSSQFKTDEDRADAFADAVIKHQCLLVLDGLEPMQHGGKGMDGRLKDGAMIRLLKHLVNSNDSPLCVITSRIPVYELADKGQVVKHDLNNLTTNDGIQLLGAYCSAARYLS